MHDVRSVSLHYPESIKKGLPPLEALKVPISQDLVGHFEEMETSYFRPEGPPPRVSVDLPESRHLHLDLQIGGLLGKGRSGFVFSVIQGGEAAKLPPLAVKVARQSFNKFVAREAWFYDELACLQGSVIPRCFGFFSAKPSADVTIDWDTIRPNHQPPSQG